MSLLDSLQLNTYLHGEVYDGLSIQVMKHLYTYFRILSRLSRCCDEYRTGMADTEG